MRLFSASMSSPSSRAVKSLFPTLSKMEEETSSTSQVLEIHDLVPKVSGTVLQKQRFRMYHLTHDLSYHRLQEHWPRNGRSTTSA